MKTIVITGASSGIGKAAAKHFAEKGWRVAATMRAPENETELGQIKNVSLYALDVIYEDAVQSVAQKIVGDVGKVDVVVNNAGYGLMGPFEAASVEQIKTQYDTNVFGLMSVTRAFLPHFREQKSGMFINISSIGGLSTLPFFSLYHGTKWAVEGFTESMSYELSALGIQVKLIEPGLISTDFAGRSMVWASKPGLTAYSDMLERFLKNPNLYGGSAPELVAEVVYTAATDGKSQLRYLAGADAEQMHGMRQANGDDAFVATVKQMMLA